jgi:hypothetical protein
MNRLWIFLVDSRTLAVLGLAALAAFLFVGANTLELALVYVAVAVVLGFLVWLVVWLVRRAGADRAGRALEKAIDKDARKSAAGATPQNKAEVAALRSRLMSAVKTIKTSKLGETTGAAPVRAALVHRHRQPGGRQEHGDPQVGSDLPVRRQRRQRRPGHRRHAQLRLVLHQRRHPARHRRPLFGA